MADHLCFRPSVSGNSSSLVWLLTHASDALQVLLMVSGTDETLAIYVVLRTPYLGEAVLKSYLPRLAITVTAYAFNQPQRSPHNENGTSQSPTRDLVWTDAVKQSEDPVIVVQGSEEDGGEADEPHVYAIWKMDAFLGMTGRSRMAKRSFERWRQVVRGSEFRTP